MEIRKATVNNIAFTRCASSKPITCNFTAPADDAEIQSVTVTVRTQSALYSENACTVRARALINAVCKVENASVSFENTVDFDVVFVSDKITENGLLHCAHIAQNIKKEKQGDGYAISAIIDSEADFLIVTPCEYTADLNGAIVKSGKKEALSFFARCGGSADFEQEKEVSLLAYKMLAHEESVRVSGVQCGVNEVIVDGEIYAEFLFTTERGETFGETLVCPFRYEIEKDGCLPEMTACAYAEIVSVAYRMENDPSDGKNMLYASYGLNFCAVVCRSESVTYVDDAFSTDCELNVSREQYDFITGVRSKEFRYRCFGEVTADKPCDNVVAVAGGGIYALNYAKDGDNLAVSGILRADVVTNEKEGGRGGAAVELAFQTSFPWDGEPLSVIAEKRNLSVKRLNDRLVAEAEIVVTATVAIKTCVSMVAEVAEGEKKAEDDAAVKIIFVEKGDDCWTVCKKAGVGEECLKQQNPDLIFPAEKNNGIVVYRKIDL